MEKKPLKTKDILLAQFAVKINRLSKACGGQKKLATLLNVHRNTVWGWSKGLVLPDLDAFREICIKTKTSADELLDLKPTNKLEHLRDSLMELIIVRVKTKPILLQLLNELSPGSPWTEKEIDEYIKQNYGVSIEKLNIGEERK